MVLGPLLFALGCGPASAPLARAPEGGSRTDLRALASSLVENEGEVLATLGRGDPRLAVRIPGPVEPTGGEPAIEAGLYSAEVRARSLGEAVALFEGWRGEETLRASRADGVAGLRLERELLRRLLAAETFRVEEEKDLPRAGSEIVRGIILVGADPSKAPWVTRRLEEIRLLLRPGSLSALESAELDDSLDPLERGAPTAALAAIAALRVALAEIKVSPARAAEPERIARALRLHLGVSGPLAGLGEALQHAESLLRAEVTLRGRRAASGDLELAESHAQEIVGDGTERCVEGDPRSIVRAALPPPERWAACQALAALVAARGDIEMLSTLIALHDATAIALWALAARADGMDPEHANERWRLLAAIPPERQVRILRAAVARPIPAIAAGLAAEMVTRGGVQDAPRAAAAWRRFGDAPFDLIERERVLSSPRPPISPRP